MTQATHRALIVIDLQNDYFPAGKYPLCNTDAVLSNIEAAIDKAHKAGDTVLLVQHIARGPAPFFNAGTEGVEIHPDILAAAPEAQIVVKQFADGFVETTLERYLSESGIESLLICGMMTQNCVTHTAISDSARKYQVAVLADCCTTVDEMIHNIALNALTTRIPLLTLKDAYPVS